MRLVKTTAAAEPVKEKDTKSIQMEAFAFAAGAKGLVDATARDKHSQKWVRQPSGEELSGGACKARKILTPKIGSNAGNSDPSQASWKAGKGRPEKAGPSRMERNRGLRPLLGPQQPQSRVNQGEDSSWTKVERKRRKKKPQVEENRDAKPRRRLRAGAKREKGDKLVIRTEQSKYSEVLKAMRSDAKLMDLGADMRTIRRSCTGEMILEFKCDK